MRELAKTYEFWLKPMNAGKSNLLERPCVPALRKVFTSIHELPRRLILGNWW
jgi:hypothetical protein